MKALVPTGRPEALVAVADTGLPEPQPGEALVKVEAFSVNRLAPAGTLIWFGQASREPATLSFFDILGGPETVTIRSFAYWDSPVPYGRDLAVLLRLVATGGCIPRSAAWRAGKTPPRPSPTCTTAASAATPSSPSLRRELP
jgi:NADPH:quinone reductase-like Zn-dependent oxidoreductase